MNGQAPQKSSWKDVAENLEIAIHNTQINLELLKAQLKEAEAHARGS